MGGLSGLSGISGISGISATTSLLLQGGLASPELAAGGSSALQLLASTATAQQPVGVDASLLQAELLSQELAAGGSSVLQVLLASPALSGLGQNVNVVV